MTAITRASAKELATVMSLIYTANILGRYLEKEVRKHGSPSLISFSIFNFLFYQPEGASPMTISRWVQRPKQTVTAVLNNLEKEGLVQKKTDQNDNRSITVSLTEKGRERGSRWVPFANEVSREALISLTGEQKKNLHDLLRQLRISLLSANSENGI